MMFGKKGLIPSLESGLTTLAKRRDTLGAQLVAAEAEAERAQAERRRVLIDTDDPKPLAAAEKAFRSADDRRGALADAVAEIDRRLADAEARLAAARDTAERERVAGLIEASATKLEAAAAALDEVLKPLAKAYSNVREAVPAAHGKLPPDRIASAILADALARAVPDAFEAEHAEIGGSGSVLRRAFAAGGAVVFRTRNLDVLDEALGAAGAAGAFLTSEMRANATAIREGEAPAVLPAPPVEPEPQEPEFPECPVVFLKPTTWRGRSGQPRVQDAGSTRVPAPVAEAAIQRGLAVHGDSDKGRTAWAEIIERNRRRNDQRLDRTLRVDDCVDLGVNVRGLVEAEHQRLLDEWRKRTAA